MISVSCPAFSFTPLDETLEIVEKEFGAMEIVAEAKHGAWNIERESFNIAISIHAPFNDINLASLKEEHRLFSLREIKRIIEVASKKNIDVVTIHPGWPSPLSMLDEEGVKERAARSIRDLDKEADNLGITLCVENMPIKNFFSDVSELGTVAENICLDVGHANITGTLDGFLKDSKKIGNLHLHENCGELDEHLPLTGDHIDIKNIISHLRDYRGFMVIEARSIEEALRSRDFLKNIKNVL